MAKREYTTEIHIDRLVAILNSKDLCNSCPAAKYYNGNHNCMDLWSNEPCAICCEFVGYRARYAVDCPCVKLGDIEAYDTTIKKLREVGITIEGWRETLNCMKGLLNG